MYFYLIAIPSEHLTLATEPYHRNSPVSKDETVMYNKRLLKGHHWNVSALHNMVQNGNTQGSPTVLSRVNILHYLPLALSLLF